MSAIFYGPGTIIDENAPSVPDDSRRLFETLVSTTPGFTQDRKLLDAVTFDGSAHSIVPGPLKSGVVASALHAMAGVVANELLELRDGPDSKRGVAINTDHAALWLGSVGMTEKDGRTVREIHKSGDLPGIYPKDLEKGTFGTPLRLRATANYPTRDPGVWYQLHGSLNADPVLRTIGLDPNTKCESQEEAYNMIADHVKNFGANELDMINVTRGLCGSPNYTPDEWRQTRMAKDLDKHPLVNVKKQTYLPPSSAVPLARIPTDKRPLAGIKVVEVVRIIAGPVIGTTLASLGADVIRVNCSRLPDFNSLQPTLNAGVRTVDVDIKKPKQLESLKRLIAESDIFIQGYRSGVLAKAGLGLHDILEMANKRGKGIVYLEENCYGPDGCMQERPGWQQVADAGSGCSYVVGRSLGHTDGTCVLPALPVPDMLTGLVGAIGAMMGIRDRARTGGSYHTFASLMAAALLHLRSDVGLYSPETVRKSDELFKWGVTTPAMFVLELLDVVLEGWKTVLPQYFAADSPFMTHNKGKWGHFRLLKPVVQLSDKDASPTWTTAPEPNCLRECGTVKWLEVN